MACTTLFITNNAWIIVITYTVPRARFPVKLVNEAIRRTNFEEVKYFLSFSCMEHQLHRYEIESVQILLPLFSLPPRGLFLLRPAASHGVRVGKYRCGDENKAYQHVHLHSFVVVVERIDERAELRKNNLHPSKKFTVDGLLRVVGAGKKRIPGDPGSQNPNFGRIKRVAHA